MSEMTPLERKLEKIVDNHELVTGAKVLDSPAIVYKGRPKHVQVDFEPKSIDMCGVDDIPEGLDEDMGDAGFTAVTGQMGQAVYKDTKFGG